MRKLTIISLLFLVGTLSNMAYAGELQIQLRGEMPKRVSANLVFEDTLSSECRSGPCTIDASQVKIRRHSSGVGVLNVKVPSEATRICLQGLRGAKMVSTTLYMNNNQQHKTKRGGNIHSDGSGGCSNPKARATDAKLWVVEVE